jgi:phenylacetate-CoA ligase
MAKITGRSDDMLIIRGVNVFPTQIEEQLLRCPGLAPHFMLEITRPDRLDEVAVQVEARPDLAEQAYSEQGALLAGLIKEQVGISTRVTVAKPETLARSQGKAAHVRDLRDKG